MTFAPLPALATWRHVEATEGYEVLAPAVAADGSVVLTGRVTAVEDGHAYAIGYRIEVDALGRTRSAAVDAWWPHGTASTSIESDGAGSWTVDGVARPDLDGIIDVDLECSACTNALPVRRLALAVGESGPASAVYVRSFDLAVERLEQGYTRRPDPGDGTIVHAYESPEHDTYCDLVADAAGLVLSYPGIAVRAL